MADQEDTITIRFDFCFGSYFQITCSSDQIPNFKSESTIFGGFFLQNFCLNYNVEVRFRQKECYCNCLLKKRTPSLKKTRSL